MFNNLDADISVSSRCTIISTNIPTLTTAGGASLLYGTQNVTIYCLSFRNNVISGTVQWFFPNGDPVRTQDHEQYQPGSPYYRNVIPSQLIIPSFVNPYNGTYSCGPSTDINDVPQRGDTISLTLSGMCSSTYVILRYSGTHVL